MESRDRKLVKTYEPLGGAPVREEGGRLVLEAQEEHSGSLMFHDHSKMSVEKEMTRVTKNALYHAQMTELMKKEITQIRAAITGRSG
jgi:flagellar basal body rod protein FlgB